MLSATRNGLNWSPWRRPAGPRPRHPTGSSAHALSHPLAASERGHVAGYSGGSGSLVARCADLHPLVPRRRLEATAWSRAGAGRPIRDGVPGWHEHASAPEGGRSGQKGGSGAERDTRRALGRSPGSHRARGMGALRGGYGTKACVITDGRGRTITFRLAPGQAHELPHAVPLLDQLTGVPK